MEKFILKTGRRKSQFSRTAIRNAIAAVYGEHIQNLVVATTRQTKPTSLKKAHTIHR